MGEQPIVCTMADEAKRNIILDNSSIYLKGTECYVYEDCTLMQQNAQRKAYEERHKKTRMPSQEDKVLAEVTNLPNK